MAVGYEIGSEAEFDAYMDATQTVIDLKAGQVLTQEQVDQITFAFDYERRDQENAVDVYEKGYRHGILKAGGKAVADLIAAIEGLQCELATQKALNKFYAASAPSPSREGGKLSELERLGLVDLEEKS